MIVYCHSDSFPGSISKSIIEFVLNRIGFFFEWTTNLSSLPAGQIVITHFPEAKGIDRDGLIINIPRRHTLKEMSSDNLDWNEHITADTTIPILTESGISEKGNDNNLNFTYDLVANIYVHLARIEEYNLQHPDEVDQKLKLGILYKYDRFLTPVVDIIINDFKIFLENIFAKEKILCIKKAPYPNGQNIGIALTHDVDIVRAYHPLKKFVFRLLILFGLIKNRKPADLDSDDRVIWAFDRLLDFYRTKKWKATFFFLAKYREGLHFRYRISAARFRNLFQQLKRAEHEIAFHPSRYAFDSPRRYAKEKNRLQKISETDINGLRHHYLRCLFPQIWQVADSLNLKYDATMIYRRFSGFRSGTTGIHPAYYHQEDLLPLVSECPTHFFENTLPEEGLNEEASSEVINKIFDRILKYQGLFVVLWHTNNLYANPPYPELWSKIIEMIESADGYLTTLTEHVKWIEQRNNVSMTKIETSDAESQIELSLPSDISSLVLILPEENMKMNSDESGIGLMQKKNCIYLTDLNNRNSVSLRISHGK